MSGNTFYQIKIKVNLSLPSKIVKKKNKGTDNSMPVI
jgi:hypothetical protein